MADFPLNILAIRFARLGDIILLLPALSVLKASFPNARLTFLTGKLCEPIGEMCPAIDEVISVDRLAMRDGPILTALAGMRRLIDDVRRREFDLAIDFHSFRETNLLTWLSGSRKRLGLKRYKAAYLSFCFNMPPALEDKDIHVTEMFLRVVNAVGAVAKPAACNLVVPGAAQLWAAEQLPPRDRIAIYVDSSGADKSWPPERFAEIADFAIEELGANVAILSGRDGDTAARVQSAARNSSLRVFPGLSLQRMAALIASSRLLLSNDTGPMHFGPALGIPTLGLFSVGLPQHFRPMGPGDEFLRANPIEGISSNEVINVVRRMWTRTAGPDLQR